MVEVVQFKSSCLSGQVPVSGQSQSRSVTGRQRPLFETGRDQEREAKLPPFPKSWSARPSRSRLPPARPAAAPPLVESRSSSRKRRPWRLARGSAARKTVRGSGEFFKPEKMYSLISQGSNGSPAPVRLLRLSWLLKQARRRAVLPCRQDLEGSSAGGVPVGGGGEQAPARARGRRL